MKHLVYIFLLIPAVLCVDPLVLTKNGLVRGLIADDGDYAMFLGIPYANVDVENPFGHATEVEPSEETFHAYYDSDVCPHLDDFNSTIVGTLDCLKVNVYVPDSATSQHRLPVMVWIHGGGFRRWHSSRFIFGPKFLVKHEVILVTFNYRLGPYGFLSLNTSDIPGNAGLRDQLAALKWVKENIAAFGGDDENITLFGESAGAASVEFHLLSGYSQGLFHKVIIESGTTLCDWVMAEPDTEAIIKIADHMGFETEDTDEAVGFLSKSDPLDLMSAVVDLDYTLKFKPTVEHSFDGVQAMIKDKPSHLLKYGAYYSVPIIFGFNSHERLDDLRYYLDSSDYFETSGKMFDAKLKAYFDIDGAELTLAGTLVENFYLGRESINEKTVYGMIEFDTDFTFIYPARRSMKYHLDRNKRSIYQYMFSYSGERNLMKNRLNLTSESGGVHADELGYLFDQSYVTKPVNERDQVIIDRMTTMWTNFAKYSNPTPYVNEIITTTWQPLQDEESSKLLLIDDNISMESHPYHQRMAFWDAFFELYGDKEKW